jgi:hypothetical protein
MNPTLVQITLFNAILNPYPGPRPKNPPKLYNMKHTFETIVKSFELPNKLGAVNVSRRTFVDHIRIDEVFACLPGGRGCVGKERMGHKLLDRQVARLTSKGVRYNPNYDASKEENYGFLQIVGVLKYKDGKESNINIPVEPSGVIGLRTGASSLAKIGPDTQNNLMSMVKEIQTLLFGMLGFRAVAEPKFGMINGMFNLYTEQTGKQRPKMERFVQSVRDIHKAPPMREYYQKPAMPWLRVQPGVPSVMKAVYRPVPDKDRQKSYRRDEQALPTLTLSPYGHVEVMGGKSVDSIVDAYQIITDSASRVTIATAVEKENDKTSRKKPRPFLQQSINSSMLVLKKRGNRLFVGNKLCESLPKPIVTRLAQEHGVPSRGTKQVVCERIREVV